MKLVDQLKGGSLSKTALYTDGSKKWVRKSILISNNREYGLVRWQSQLRKLQLLGKELPKNVITVFNSGIESNYYFLTFLISIIVIIYMKHCRMVLMQGLLQRN